MSWIQTYTGKKFEPLNPDPDAIDIEDIAHSLSLICRYTGHCKRFYSVAEHCVRMSDEYKRFPVLALVLLMHDASEAYICDVAKPVKPLLIGYAEIEEKIMKVIFKKYNVNNAIALKSFVNKIDIRMGITEKMQLMSKEPESWNLPDYEPFDITITCWSPRYAEKQFLKRFEELTK